MLDIKFICRNLNTFKYIAGPLHNGVQKSGLSLNISVFNDTNWIAKHSRNGKILPWSAVSSGQLVALGDKSIIWLQKLSLLPAENIWFHTSKHKNPRKKQWIFNYEYWIYLFMVLQLGKCIRSSFNQLARLSNSHAKSLASSFWSVIVHEWQKPGRHLISLVSIKNMHVCRKGALHAQMPQQYLDKSNSLRYACNLKNSKRLSPAETVCV